MRCPLCDKTDSKVIDSRGSPMGDAIRRRRECNSCGHRFTTYERAEEAVPFVVKKGGRRELFDRTKVLRGLKRACEKRPVSIKDLEILVENLESDLLDGGVKEVDSSRIGEATMARLRELDEVAYVRFASVYRSFRDIDEFMSELAVLLKQRPGSPDEQG